MPTTISEAKKKNASKKAKSNGHAQPELPHTQGASKKGDKHRPGDNTALLQGEWMPRIRRRKASEAPKKGKVEAKRGTLYVDGTGIPYSAVIQIGPEGDLYLIPKITVATAKALLRRTGPGQRGLRSDAVRRYTTDMKQGNFQWTGEPIRIDKRAYLTDGQHRLTSVVRSRVTLKNQIICVIAKSIAIVAVDEGVRRTPSDRRAFLGKTAHTPTILSACCFEASPDWKTHTTRGYSNAEVDDIVDAVTYLNEVAQWQAEAKRSYARLDNSFAAVAIRCMKIPGARKDARQFFGAVAIGEHTIEGRRGTVSAVKAACNHMQRQAVAYAAGKEEGDERKARYRTVHHLVVAWNAFRQRKDIPSPWKLHLKKDETIPKAI